jgi:hypothetical protein
MLLEKKTALSAFEELSTDMVRAAIYARAMKLNSYTR